MVLIKTLLLLFFFNNCSRAIIVRIIQSRIMLEEGNVWIFSVQIKRRKNFQSKFKYPEENNLSRFISN
jgi:hypothetical protein